MTNDSERLLSALCYVYGYVSAGVTSVLEQWDQRMGTAGDRADMHRTLVRLAELLDCPLDELPGWVFEHERKRP